MQPPEPKPEKSRNDPDPPDWISAAGARKLLYRLAVGLGLGGIIYGGYLILQRHDIRPIWWLEPSFLESRIPKSNSATAVHIYLSFYLLILIPGFVRSDRQFCRFLVALTLTGLISLCVFLLIPSGVIRPPSTLIGASQAYMDLVEFDLPRNAFPSLHASVSFLCGISGSLVFKSFPARSLLWIWVVAVLWSTMATHQHVLFDLVSGAALALVTWTAAGKYPPCRENSI